MPSPAPGRVSRKRSAVSLAAAAITSFSLLTVMPTHASAEALTGAASLSFSMSPVTSSGAPGQIQRAVVQTAAGFLPHVQFLDSTGRWVSSMPVAGQGTFQVSVMPGGATLYFFPVPGFTGKATPVTFRVTVPGMPTQTSTYIPEVVDPTLKKVATEAPTFDDRSGTASDSYIVPPTEGVRYHANGQLVGAGLHTGATGTVRVTAEPQPGYELTGAIEWEHTFSTVEVADKTSTGPVGVKQSTKVTLPEATNLWLLADRSDLAQRSSRVERSEGVYEASLSDGTITFTPANGFTGKAAGVAYVLVDALSERPIGSATYVPTVEKPQAIEVKPWSPQFFDGLGGDDDSYTIPSVAGVRYLANGEHVGAGRHRASGAVVVTAEAQSGYSLTGPASWDHSFSTAAPQATSSGAPRTVQYALVVPDTVDHSVNVTYVDPATGATAYMPAISGVGQYYIFRDASRGGINLGFVPESGFRGAAAPITVRVTRDGVTTEHAYVATSIARVQAEAPTFEDGFATASDAYVIPATDGVRYRVDGEVVGAGRHRATGTVVVTAEAQPFHQLSGESRWEFSFSSAGAVDLTSTGALREPQSVKVDLPQGARLALVPSNGGADLNRLETSEGTYEVAPYDGTLTFSPSYAFGGTAPSITYVIVTKEGERSTATYTPTVLAPEIEATPLTSSGLAGEAQSVTVPLPDTAVWWTTSVQLLDEDGKPTSELAVPGVGVYKVTGGLLLSPALTFTPHADFSGTAPAVRYRVTSFGKTAEATYTATVTPLQKVAAEAPTFEDGYGTVRDSLVIPATTGVQYLVNSDRVGAGLHHATGTVVVTAQPQRGYQLTGDTRWEFSYSSTGAVDLTSAGTGRHLQQIGVEAPQGATLRLVHDGTLVSRVDTPQGVYQVGSSERSLTFAPAVGFSGVASGVTYAVTVDGETTTATYTPTVDKPADPVATALTSAGVGTAAQHADVTVPEAGTVTLLDADGRPAGSLTVPGEGTYAVSGDGPARLTFSPENCFYGDTDGVRYRVTDQYGQSGDSTYSPVVAAPEASAPVELSSEGTGTEQQSATVEIPECGTVTLLDGERETHTVTREGEGAYTLDAETGRITFTPVFGYSGQPAPLAVLVDDGYGNRVTGHYAVTVHAPAAPVVEPLTSSGVGTATQRVTVALGEGDTLALLHGDVEAAELAVPGEGTYLVDAGTVSFVPATGFHGTATPVTFQVTDAYGQHVTSSYTPSVTMPAAPVVSPVVSQGPATESQAVHIEVPAGGSLALVGSRGKQVRKVVVKGQGAYRVDSAAATIAFTPTKRFHGAAKPVTFVVTDAYGQAVRSTYRATVAAAPTAHLGAPRQVRSATVVRSVVRVKGTKAEAAKVTAYASVDGERTIVGRGRTVLQGESRKVVVPVKLNAVGRALAARPGGVRITLTSDVRGADGHRYAATTRTSVVARTVKLRPIYFGTDSAALSRRDRAYLLRVRRQLGDVSRVVCVGYADARSTVTYNQALGRARAKAVCAVLTKGVRAEIVTVSRGETRPVAPDATERGRALNRRVEITLGY